MKALNQRNVFLLANTAWLALAAAPVTAQTPTSADQTLASAADEADKSDDTIIVTGTLLRGIAPPGAAPLTLSRTDAIATGATTTAQLLANVPQVGDFNARPVYRGVFNTQQTVNHPELRNLTVSLVGSSATLLLLDGHRLPGMGVRQTIPDSDAIPPGAIERVEILTDGGSSTYGADAVGGVVNYIVRKRFDGVEASANYGFADNYKVASGDLTIGKDWGSGSIFGTYSFNWHDEIYGRDRDYVQNRDYVRNVPTDLTCSPGNVIIGTAIYALPGLAASANGNRCDNNEEQTIYPREKRHSAFVGLTQELTDGLEVSLNAFYTNRVNISDGGPLTQTVTVAANNPLYRSVGGTNAAASQVINFNYAALLGNSSLQRNELNTWGVSGTVTAKLGTRWQVRGLLNYGEATNTAVNAMANTTLVSTTLVPTAQFNPYDLSDPRNAAVRAQIANWSNYGRGAHQLYQYRAIADGPLFELPAGEVSLAVGAEYLIEDYRVRSGVGFADAPGTRPFGAGHRNTKAAFGELYVPVVGEGNRTGGIHSLSLSASARYDDYSDFGGTFNPKLALTYEPVEWFKLRGSWGKSFQAPSLADSQGAITNTITVLPRVQFVKPGLAALPTDVQVFLSGSFPGLKAQKATIWSLGADLKPTLIPGFGASVTYYNIKFKDRIGSPELTRADFYTVYPDQAILRPTTALLQNFAGQATNGVNQLVPFFATPERVYSIIDSRRSNFSAVNTSGIDFSANLDLPTGFGSVYARVAGNYVLTRNDQLTPVAPVLDSVNNASRLRVSSTLGTTIEGFRGQVTWLYSGKFDIVPSALNLNQSQVNSYSTFNLFLQYEFKEEGLFRDLSLTLNVDNILDKDPPIQRNIVQGYGNGFTLGRLFQFGVRKKF